MEPSVRDTVMDHITHGVPNPVFVGTCQVSLHPGFPLIVRLYRVIL